jgi:16S rRNA processing protein RimM
MADYFNIGRIAATFGLQGELILVHKIGRTDALKNIPVLFIEERKNSFLPYFIDAVRSKSADELYVKLEGITTKEAAGKLLTKQVYLEEKQFRKQVKAGSSIYYLGFAVEDSHAGLLGNVAEVIETPAQLVLKIYKDGHELLIPLNENTLQRVDLQSHIIYVSLPDGLLDIYLQ